MPYHPRDWTQYYPGFHGPGPAVTLMNSLLAIQDRKQQRARQEEIDRQNAEMNALKMKAIEDEMAKQEYERMAAVEAQKSAFETTPATPAEPGPAPAGTAMDEEARRLMNVAAYGTEAPTLGNVPLAPALPQAQPASTEDIFAQGGVAPIPPPIEQPPTDLPTSEVGGAPAFAATQTPIPQKTFKLGNVEIPLLRKEEVQAKALDEFKQKLEQERMLTEAKTKYVAMPNDPRFGAFAGKQVPIELADNLITMASKPPVAPHITDLGDKVAAISPTGEVVWSKPKGKAPGAATSAAPEEVSPGLIGEDLLNSLNAQDKSVVKQLIEGTADPRSVASLRNNRREYLLGLAGRVDPSFNMSNYATRAATRKDFAVGKGATNIRSLNTVFKHLDSLDKASKQLENAPVQLWNRIRNAGFTQAGDPRVTNFEKAVTAVESELANVFKGTGATDQEIKAWRVTLNSAQSPAQLKQGISTLVDLIEGRMEALQTQYSQGMGKEMSPDELLNKSSRAIYERLGKGGGESGPPAGARTAVSKDGKRIWSTDNWKTWTEY